MAQESAQRPKIVRQSSYVNLDNDEGYEKYRGNCGLIFSQAVTACGGYTRWFKNTFKDIKDDDNKYGDNNSLTYGVTFGGLMRDRYTFPKEYSYTYDIILRIVRGEKRFIGGSLTSQEYVYNLYIKTSVQNQSDIATKFLKKFNIISNNTDASMYRDKRRSLSLGTANSAGGAAALLVDRTSKQKTDTATTTTTTTDNDATTADPVAPDDDGKDASGDIGPAEVKEESKYEHRVCNAHKDATDAKISSDAKQDIENRVGSSYTVSITTGIPDFASMDESNETDIIVSFVKDDLFRYQGTYLKKSTFDNKTHEERKEIYDKLYKWPKSASEIFGKNIPKQNTNGLLSVLNTISTTKVDIKS